MTIHEMRELVLTMLEQEFKDAEKAGTATPEQLEAEGFMRQLDAEAIKTCCSRKNIFVSFRAAGADTLERIRQLHPCKGHDILDKSIKVTPSGWSYLAPRNPSLGNTGEEVLNALRGLVGCPDRDQAPQVIRLANGTETRVFPLGAVYSLPAGFVSAERSESTYTRLPAATVRSTELAKAYTGDYDIHDLIVGSTRPLATTPVEMDALDYLNLALLEKDSDRKELVRQTMEPSARLHQSPYALIRHGAQTSYLSFLLTDKGESDLKKEMLEIRRKMQVPESQVQLPFGSSVVRIDDHVAMFDNRGTSYILRGVGQVYRFYKDHGLLGQIPFYNFFDALLHSQNSEFRDKAAAFSKYIDEILLVNLGLIPHKSC